MFRLKQVFPFLIIASIAFLFSCKKENKETVVKIVTEYPYEKRLEGEWKLKEVEYDSEIPDLTGSGGVTNISGKGSVVNGRINFERNPHFTNYNFSFIGLTDITGTGFPLPLPIVLGGSGEWTSTSDQSKIILTEGSDQLIFDVLVNEENVQVLETTISQDIQGLLLVDLNMTLSFERVD